MGKKGIGNTVTVHDLGAAKSRLVELDVVVGLFERFADSVKMFTGVFGAQYDIVGMQCFVFSSPIAGMQCFVCFNTIVGMQCFVFSNTIVGMQRVGFSNHISSVCTVRHCWDAVLRFF